MEVEHRDGAARLVDPVGAARSDAGRAPADAGAGDVTVPDPSPEQRAAAQHLEAKRCRKASCCATEIWPFGPDRRGRRLAVITLASTEPCLLPQKPQKSSRRRAEPEEDEESDDSKIRHACSEHWLEAVFIPEARSRLKDGRLLEERRVSDYVAWECRHGGQLEAAKELLTQLEKADHWSSHANRAQREMWEG